MDLEIEDIALSRGTAGLGFNIKGGVDIPHITGDFGIFVTKIRSDGAAHSDGRLKEGDKILFINGKSLEQVTHQEAVALFMNAGETVKLKVQHGAEQHIKLQQMSEKETMNSMNHTAPRKDNSADDDDDGQFITLALSAVGIITSAVLIGFICYRKYKS